LETHVTIIECLLTIEPFIEGITNFGDNVDDEWFIVFLLRYLTKLDPELVVQIEDSDGDFLLIEAAEYLPKWLNPNTSKNRVFLHHAKLQIIPKRKDPLPHGVPSISDALKTIRSPRHETKASKEIQSIIEKRVKEFPSLIRKHQQRSRCFVPSAVASLLAFDPFLVTHAVKAFVERDIFDSQAMKVMKHFPPENRVHRIITMTRCQYAQLMSIDFQPDKRVGWEIPPKTSHLHKSYDLGMKVACGFEILASAAKRTKASETISEELSMADYDLDHDKRWMRFIQVLYLNGYFKELLKGSRDYNERLKRAKRYFVNNILPVVSDESSSQGVLQSHQLTSKAAVGRRISKILKSLEVDYEKLRSEEPLLGPEDSDKWMKIDLQDFDAFLKEKFLSPVVNTNLSDLNTSLPLAINKFVESESGIPGVASSDVRTRVLIQERERKKRLVEVVSPEISGGKTPEVATSSNGRVSKSPTKSEAKMDETAGFDPDNFVNALRNILTLKVPSDPEPSSSDMSDYSDEDESDSDEDESPDSTEKSYTKGMDELAFLTRNQRLNLGSREKEQSRNSNNNDLEEEDEENDTMSQMKNYMNLMDKELAFKLKHGKTKVPLANIDDDFEDGFTDGGEDDEDEKIEMDAVENILQSLKPQEGRAGPSSLLNSVNLFIPRNVKP
jgi:hypothetical protein